MKERAERERDVTFVKITDGMSSIGYALREGEERDVTFVKIIRATCQA